MSSRVAKALAKKLVGIREGRGLSQVEANKQLGLNLHLYKQLEAGRFIPTSWVLDRIERWATKGHTFTRESPRVGPQVERSPGWQKVSVRLPPHLLSRLRRVSSALGLTQAETIFLALEYWLDEPGVQANYAEAAKRLWHARVLTWLQENPELKRFLEADLEYCVDIGAELCQPNKPVKGVPPIEKVLGDDPLLALDTYEKWEIT